MTDFGVGGEEDDDDDLDDMLLDATSIVPPDHHHHHHHHLCFLDGDDGGNNPSSFVPDPIPFPSPNNSSPSSIGQMDHFFFNDHDLYPQDPNHHLNPASSFDEEFLSDLLLDSPLPLDPSSSEIQLHYSDPNPNLAKNSSEEDEQQPTLTHQLLPPPPPPISQPQQGKTEEENQLNTNDSNNDDADPVAKKRKRQLRNRDAAVRSRERKKMYVKDLEMKSSYYEAECRRLGMLLLCYVAENHALRLSFLNNNTQALDVSTTKQESAVLFLESLLLGSLLWFLGIMALCTLPRQLLSILAETGVEKVACKIRGSLAPREAGTNVYGLLEFQSFMMSKRCRGSRRKMRCPAYRSNVSDSLHVSFPSFYL